MSIKLNGTLSALILTSFASANAAPTEHASTEKTESHSKSETATSPSDGATDTPYLGQGYAGLIAGWTKPSNAAGRFGFGGHLGLKATPNFSGGLYFLSSLPGDNTDTTTVTTDQTRTHQYGVEGQYHFEGALNGLSAGLRVGLASVQNRVTDTAVWTSDTKFAFGPLVSYQYPVIESMLSVGVDASYLYVMGTGSHGEFLGGGGVTYWF